MVAQVAQGRRSRGRPPVTGLAERRRRQIVDAAFIAFTEHGYEQTSMADIAVLAGMGQGTVYRYVDGKREVLDLVFDYAVERLFESLALDEVLDMIAGIGDVENRNDVIAGMGGRLYGLIDREPGLLKLLSVQSLAADKELKRRVLGIQGIFDSYVRLGLERGRRAGWLIDDPRSHTVLARLLPALILPGLVLSLDGHGSTEFRERFDRAASQLVVGGLLRQGAQFDGTAAPVPSEPVEPPRVPAALFDDRRNALLDAALECFSSSGYNAVGVQEIVEVLGASHGAFYNYYQSKRDLLDALIIRETAVIESMLPDAGVRLESLADVETALAQGFQHAVQSLAPRLRQLTFMFVEAPGVDAETLRALQRFYQYAATRCEQNVYSVVGADRIAPAIDGEFLGQAFVAMVAAAATLLADGRDSAEEIEECARITARFLLYGLNLAPAA